jgi:DNA polymerase-3 subunit alpha
VRYGQNYQAAKQELQNSLFGSFDSVEIATPVVPKTDVRWSDIERLNKERDLVGIYLSAHPLDEYKIVLDNLCNTKCTELADRCAKLVDRDDITLGGIVTNVQTRFSAKTNKPWGIVTLEDFEGSGELALFGDDWLNLNGKFFEGAAVYVTGKMRPRFYNTEDKELKVTNVELLQSVKEKAVDRIVISLNNDLLDEQVVTELSELIRESPGKTKLFFQLRDSTGKHHVLLRSKTRLVDVRHTLIDYIEQHEGLDYNIN